MARAEKKSTATPDSTLATALGKVEDARRIINAAAGINGDNGDVVVGVLLKRAHELLAEVHYAIEKSVA